MLDTLLTAVPSLHPWILAFSLLFMHGRLVELWLWMEGIVVGDEVRCQELYDWGRP